MLNDIKTMSTVGVNWPSNIGQEWTFLWHQLLTSNWRQLLSSNWCCTLIFTKISNKIFFQTNFCCQWLFSRYILDIILNSSIRYLQFDISRMSKSGGDVPWYWPNVDVNLKFECPLGGNIGLVMKSITFEKVDCFFYLKTIFILFCIIKYIMNTFHWLIQSHYHMQL